MNAKIAIKELTIEYEGYLYYEKITTSTNYGEFKIEYIVSDTTSLTTYDFYDTFILDEKIYSDFISKAYEAIFVKVNYEVLTLDEKLNIATKYLYKPEYEYVSKYKIKMLLDIDGKIEVYNEEFIDSMITNKQYRLILLLNKYLKKDWKLEVLGTNRRNIDKNK